MRRKSEFVFFGTAAVRIMYPTLASANTGKYFPALLGFFKTRIDTIHLLWLHGGP
jgi:hypothetical protein